MFDSSETNEDTNPFAPYYFKFDPEIICDQEVTPILDEFVEDYPSVEDRFYTRYYYLKPGADNVCYQVLFHSNHICLICLPPQHPARKAGIASLNFDIGNADRSKNAVRGKGKKGGMLLQADSTLALLTDVTGKVYKVPSCIRGKLIEVNLELAENPKRLETVTDGTGYLAIILPKLEHCEEIKSSLMTHEQYQAYISKQPESETQAL